MMTMMAILIFGGAFALATYAMTATLAPQMQRIVEILSGRTPPRFAPLTALVHAERRIAVRRWAGPVASAYRPREAA